ncbi:MAG: transposase [Gammaproteobacteria bacterium]|nr:transposase [Gammaproteobacteria bacterium]
MPRKPRFQLIGMPQHVVQRGNNRQACFFAEVDYLYYLDALGRAAQKYGSRVHAYVLMTNHVHLLMTPDRNEALSSIMQSVGRRYVRYVNKEYRRSGTLWEGRFKSSLIQSERYLLSCYRYIELNPVRAGMVDHPAEYRWSSYQANAQGVADVTLTDHDEYRRLGRTDVERQAAYRELFQRQLDPGLIDQIRGATNHELVVGTNRFKDEIAAMTKRRVRMGHPGRPRKEPQEY